MSQKKMEKLPRDNYFPYVCNISDNLTVAQNCHSHGFVTSSSLWLTAEAVCAIYIPVLGYKSLVSKGWFIQISQGDSPFDDSQLYAWSFSIENYSAEGERRQHEISFGVVWSRTIVPNLHIITRERVMPAGFFLTWSVFIHPTSPSVPYFQI